MSPWQALTDAAGDVRRDHAPNEFDQCIADHQMWPCSAELLAELVMTREAIENPDAPDLRAAYDLALVQIEHDGKTIERLAKALRVANHRPHDRSGPTDEASGLPTCSDCGAILMASDAPDLRAAVAQVRTAFDAAWVGLDRIAQSRFTMAPRGDGFAEGYESGLREARGIALAAMADAYRTFGDPDSLPNEMVRLAGANLGVALAVAAIDAHQCGIPDEATLAGWLADASVTAWMHLGSPDPGEHRDDYWRVFAAAIIARLREARP